MRTPLFPALQTLVLHNVPNLCALRFSLLVPHLTALELINTPLGADNTTALQHLSTLMCLQSCFIGSRDDEDTPEPGGDDTSLEALSYLCSSLTSLSFTPKSTSGEFTADLVPAAGWPLLKRICMRNPPCSPPS